MTDVEKYGVFALVFVLGVLGLIVFYDGDPGDAGGVGPDHRNALADGRSQTVIIRTAADVPGQGSGQDAGRGPVPVPASRSSSSNASRRSTPASSTSPSGSNGDGLVGRPTLAGGGAGQVGGQTVYGDDGGLGGRRSSYDSHGNPATRSGAGSQTDGGSAGRGSSTVRANDRPPVTYRVRSPVDAEDGFDFAEAPMRYPGERSSLGRTAKDGTLVHVVRSGGTLSDIANKYFGSPGRWRDIQNLNPGLDPKKMRPGDEVVVAGPAPAGERAQIAKSVPQTTAAQPAPAAAKPAPEPESTYVVRKGDTLGAIAQRFLGSAKRVNDLYVANRGLLDSPHDLKIGLELRIP